jgi:hypothetical protein
MNHLLGLLLLIITGTFFYPGAAHAAPAPGFTIIYSNDVLGELELCGCDEEQLGGLPRRAAVINALQKEGRPLLVLDAGNLFFKERSSSTIEKNEFSLKSEYILEAYKKTGCDSFNVGETDLFMGLEHLKILQKKAGFPFVSSNLYSRKSGKPLFQPFVIKAAAGIKIGILGLFSEQGSVEPSIEIKNPVEAAKKSVASIKNTCSFIIVLSNLGLEGDKKLAKNIPDIDLIIGGRAAQRMPEPVKEGKTIIVQAYRRGQYLGRLDVTAQSASVKPQFAMKNTLIPLGEKIADDKAIAQLTKEYRARVIAMNRQEFFKEKLNDKKVLAAGEALYTGAEKCASCHKPQYDNWLNTPHANAYETLMKNCNNFDIECLPCHTTGFKEPGGFAVSQSNESVFINVQCEACHGPGKKHKALGDIIRDAGEGVCKQCHDEKNSPRFIYEEYLPIVKCPVTPKQ